jgi:hypothetical protein
MNCTSCEAVLQLSVFCILPAVEASNIGCGMPRHGSEASKYESSTLFLFQTI